MDSYASINPGEKHPLTYQELTDIIDLSLWAGQMLLQNGAEALRIEETVHHIGTGLGCNWMDILVSPNALVITATSGDQFRTKIRRVTRIGVNLSIVDAINDLSRRVYAGDIDRFALREELRRVSVIGWIYDGWLVIGMVGLGCAAFSRLFGGDAPVFAVTFIASAAAMFVRQELAKRYFNQFFIAIITAFVASLIASTATTLELGTQPHLALASSVLLLVPGVPLINALSDLIEGHILVGIARGLTAAGILLSIALGLLAAMSLMGISTL